MIWYLLYPFRGTTEAPVLSSSHPIRNVFTRYGRCAARHVVTTLLVSVAVAAILIYPFPFLYTNDFSTNASNLPHHVWTDAHPLEGKFHANHEADVIMRSIWVHGSYMQALDREVLLGALELQNELLGPTEDFNPRVSGRPAPLNGDGTDLSARERDSYHVINGRTNQSWFYHSPLQYWSGSANNIAADPAIVSTVNARKTQSTSVNVTLRHSIVFSGKRFEDRQLVAADALVITLIHQRDSPVGRMWEKRAEALAQKAADKWQVIPPDGRSLSGHLYEFQFRPISVQDAMLLTLAYILTMIYFVMSLTKLRAVKSKMGLMVTVLAQLVTSIMSSFTVCAILKIDLSRIPQLAYPLVVLSMSLENVFRLINAVILTPSEDSTSNRIGHAFGETAHIALASVAQNLLILWGFSKVVSEGVAAFCTFAAIAILFDFFYLSTFFLAVLSVDVRRTELSDALTKASIRNNRSVAEAQARQTWVDAMLQGKIAMSTRIAGTAVMVGFVLIAQWHFFDNEGLFSTFRQIFRGPINYTSQNTSRPSLLVDIHQARSPTSWLRLQDHETAREVIHVIKPWAHSYVARVYDPLVFVLKGADRMPSIKEKRFLPAAYDFVRHQSTPFVLTVIVIVAAVRLYMNYLLWDELADVKHADSDEDEPLLSVQTLSMGHKLDVALVAASGNGHVVSVGLDRAIRVWDVKAGSPSYIIPDTDDNFNVAFPLLAMCIDDESTWLALLTPQRVLLWNLVEHRWGIALHLDGYHRQRPEAFVFGMDKNESVPPVVIVRREGTLIELKPSTGESCSILFSPENPVVSVDALPEKPRGAFQIIAASREGKLHILQRHEMDWSHREIDLPLVRDQELLTIVALPELSSFLVARAQSLDLIDGYTYKITHVFKTDPIQPKSLKCFHSKRRRPQCGSVGLATLTFAYLHAYTRDCIIQTYLPERDGDTICFRDPATPGSKTCCLWQETREIRRLIPEPGVWDALPNGAIVGVRKKAKAVPKPLVNGVNGHAHMMNGDFRRRRNNSQPNPPSREQDNWEVWMVSRLGRAEAWETAPLCPDIESDGHLFVTRLGPVSRVGRASFAIGLSNVIKVIMVGQERFESADSSLLGDGLGTITSRRKKPPASLRSRAMLHTE